MKKALIIIAIAVVALLLVFRPQVKKLGGGTEVKEGEVAPDFTATLRTGRHFTLSENKDKVVVINFWATWCGPCVDELPAFQKLANDNMKDVEIIAVNYEEKKAQVDDFAKENGYTFNIAYDETGSICNLYPTNGIPYTLIIKNGVVEKTFIGEPNNPYETYKAAIQECLK